ncbi:uncharacterized protein BT62DRAFT_937018 [Guyanagaster necrorhizus]|uniref:DUF2306 domain-containing protein n=1 Tax=Guyanagaster necrorhizus TaxID=856835 RepID=A0A9P7VJ65_9AGAR|nr:uncharacterized protein BT62DRAFT_937018 [Guyanagaster necrorhizus MCA 3950]KAG7441505.1 hypothetical protein BT62DRAFT_937018 [Guyanagaster necrorhizus MCA 3950]
MPTPETQTQHDYNTEVPYTKGRPLYARNSWFGRFRPRPQMQQINLPGGAAYRTISGILGFKEQQSLLLYFIFGGALLGYCLYHAPMMNPKTMEKLTVPGEWFGFSKHGFKVAYSMHIFLSVIGGIFVLLQFIPAIRRRAILLHRMNGYFVLLCLIPANVSGGIAGYRSFGGEINAQSAYYTLGIAVVLCFSAGLFNVKSNTREHRRWMIRGVIIFSCAITTRIIVVVARLVVTDIGNYHAIFRCDDLLSVLTDLSTVSQQYPSCVADGVDISKTYVAVVADARGGSLGFGSSTRVTQGMALWYAMLTHGVMCEIYLHMTQDANYVRREFVLEPRLDSTMDLSYSPQ